MIQIFKSTKGKLKRFNLDKRHEDDFILNSICHVTQSYNSTKGKVKMNNTRNM